MATANKFCNQCGAPLAAESRFCNSCGAPVTMGAAESQVPPPQTYPSPPPPPAPPPPVPPRQQANPYGQGTTAPPVPAPYQGQNPYQQYGGNQPPTGYAPQQTYPANYGSGNYQPSGTGPLGTAPQSSKSGCLKFFIILAILAALLGGGFAAYVYFDSTGTVTMPWSDQPDPKIYIGRWQAVQLTSNGQKIDLTNEKDKYMLELLQGTKPNLNGKLTNSAFPKSFGIMELKPSADKKKYEGTAKDSDNPKEVIQISIEYAAPTQELVMTATAPKEKPSIFRFKKL